MSKLEIENLKSRYYSGENVNHLIEEYHIDISATHLHTTFPLMLSSSEICKYCNSSMYFVPPSKSNKKREEYLCLTCQHTESIFGCKCIQCLKHKNELDQETEINKLLKRKKEKSPILKIREYPNSPSLSMLSVIEKSYLGALLRVGLDKKFLLICIDDSISNKFAPTLEYRELIIAELLEKKIIIPYTLGNNITDKVTRELLGKRFYDICISDVNFTKEDLIRYLMYPNKLPLVTNDTITLLREVQIYEAIEYMQLTLQYFKLPIFKYKHRYELLFQQILNEYSEGQLFNFIYSAIKNQAAYKHVDPPRYIPISNYIYKKISDRYESARTNNWKISHFRRSWKGGQTELSMLVSNRLLDLGESSFYQVITSENFTFPTI